MGRRNKKPQMPPQMILGYSHSPLKDGGGVIFTLKCVVSSV